MHKKRNPIYCKMNSLITRILHTTIIENSCKEKQIIFWYANTYFGVKPKGTWQMHWCILMGNYLHRFWYPLNTWIISCGRFKQWLRMYQPSELLYVLLTVYWKCCFQQHMVCRMATISCGIPDVEIEAGHLGSIRLSCLMPCLTIKCVGHRNWCKTQIFDLRSQYLPF